MEDSDDPHGPRYLSRILRPQSIELFLCQPKHKILREAISVALNLFVESLGGDAIESGKVTIEQDLLSPNCNDERSD
jgi:hypothetical protein